VRWNALWRCHASEALGALWGGVDRWWRGLRPPQPRRGRSAPAEALPPPAGPHAEALAAKSDAILRVLRARFGDTPCPEARAIGTEPDPAVLDRLLLLAATAATAAEFRDAPEVRGCVRLHAARALAAALEERLRPWRPEAAAPWSRGAPPGHASLRVVGALRARDLADVLRTSDGHAASGVDDGSTRGAGTAWAGWPRGAVAAGGAGVHPGPAVSVARNPWLAAATGLPSTVTPPARRCAVPRGTALRVTSQAVLSVVAARLGALSPVEARAIRLEPRRAVLDGVLGAAATAASLEEFRGRPEVRACLAVEPAGVPGAGAWAPFRRLRLAAGLGAAVRAETDGER